MFLTCCSPMSSNEKSSLSRTSSRTMRLTQIPPGSAKACRRAAMDIDSTAYRIDDAGKLNKDAVARRLNDAPAVFRDLRIDDCASVALERGQRALFIQAHQPRITRDIPRENGREAALDPFSAQAAPPKPASTSLRTSCGWPHVVCSGGVIRSTRAGLICQGAGPRHPARRARHRRWGDRIRNLLQCECRLLADFVAKVTAEKLYNKNTQQSNRSELILESTLRIDA